MLASPLVAIDLETTGLNADRDAIIEVAAVRFAGAEVLGSFSTLIRPTVDIPVRVTQLTGLTAADLAGAPSVASALADLAAFVGTAPVVGHSVGHDLRFLRRHGLSLPGAAYDTFELAAILLPGMKRYALGGLIEELGLKDRLKDQHLHRALADAHAHRLLFMALFERASELEGETLAAINRLAAHLEPRRLPGMGSDAAEGWGLAAIFRAAAQERAAKAAASTRASVAGSGAGDSRKTPPSAPTRRPEPLHPVAKPGQLDIDALEALLSSGGPLAGEMAGYEDRPGQREMLRAVAEAFNWKGQLLVEAGTGTGKSLAYLIPAAAWAFANRQHVVVSTHTLTLQEQLLTKDLPVVRDLIDPDLCAAVLKGRTNYLCRTRLEALQKRDDLDVDAVRAAAKFLVWAPHTQSGDRAELMLQPEDERAWRLVCAEGDACTVARCGYARTGQCWVQRARLAAEAAHVVVVNHALLLSDLLVDNSILPPHAHLIIDEAHHLEDVATNTLGFDAGEHRIRDALAALETPTGRGGLLTRVEAEVAGAPLRDAKREAIGHTVAGLRGASGLGAQQARHLFAKVGEWVSENSRSGAVQSVDARLTDATRGQPAWLGVEMAWDALLESLKGVMTEVTRLMAQLDGEADALNAERPDVAAPLLADLQAANREIFDLVDGLQTIIARPTPNDICWATRGGGGSERLALRRAPLQVGDILSRQLFREKETLVLTSATLRAGDSFDFIRSRLGLRDADERVVDSPFDYTRTTLLAVPTDLPEPNQPGYQAAVDRVLVGLGQVMGGRTLVLFTSHAGLKESYHAIRGPLGSSGIAVMGQGLDGSRYGLLEAFRDPSIRTMLLGTRSFWEGIDVPGDALSCLVISRLPFDVPSDPIFAARSETFQEPFFDYSIPQAIMRFRQGFGRLIRQATDQGVVVVLDSRVRTKSYGRQFLDALPPCRRYIGPLDTLPEAARRFMAGEELGVLDSLG